MNDAQIIFTLFFAISWGIVSNVLPRWKPFHYAVAFKPTLKRLALSWAMLNFLPWILFVCVLGLLARQSAEVKDWHSLSNLWLILRAVFPGLIPFGSYHLWLAIVHAKPMSFYAQTPSDVPAAFQRQVDNGIEESEPDATSLGLLVPSRRWPGILGNGLWGITCLGLGLLFAWAL